MQQNSIIRLLFILIPLFGLVLFVRKSYKDVRKGYLRRGANQSVGSTVKTQKDGNIQDLISSIPTNASMKSLYGYAEDYAKNWASDGTLDHLNFYIDLKDGSIVKRAQIFLNSSMRNEQLTTYFPKMSDDIEELAGTDTATIAAGSKPIYSYDKWREALKHAIESSSSDIAKANEVGIQIAGGSGLVFRFTFKINNRKWSRRFPIA